MQLKHFLVAAFLASGIHAAPSSSNELPAQMTFNDALSSNPFALPVFDWLHSAISTVVPSSLKSKKHVDIFTADNKYGSLDVPDYSDKTIWEVIQENEHLTDLKRVLKYSGPGAKELLDDKSKKLTFLIPVNWHQHRHGRDDYEPGSLSAFDMSQWSMIDAQIRDFEAQDSRMTGEKGNDDEDKKRKRKALAYLIDATLHYHAIHAHEPLKAWDVAQNSSVATLFHIGNGRVREIVGNLFDGHSFRIRVGKSILPRPSAYFNFYSRLVYPDVNVGGSTVHAISLPLLIPPSALQTLFFSQPDLAGTSTALQKTHSAGYFRYPFNHSAIHHGDSALSSFASHQYTAPVPLDRDEQSVYSWHHKFEGNHTLSQGGDEHRSPYPPHPRGQTAITLFTPTNVAWFRVPPLLKVFLMSPFGLRLLSKALALHTLPYTIFYADFVHTSQHKDLQLTSQEVLPASELIRSSEWLWGPTSEQPSAIPLGKTEVTRYTFNTACPKIQHHNHSSEHDFNDIIGKDKMEFETVDVNVYRYHILPGGRGPLQTRVSVQGVPVTFQDIAVGNGALHTIDRFIMPKGHPHKGIWAHIADQAEKNGFGTVDWQAEAL